MMNKDIINAQLARLLKKLGYEVGQQHLTLIYNTADTLIDLLTQEQEKNWKPFEQVIHRCCKKCRLSYSEVGLMTKKKYAYCIYSGSSDVKVPNDCPRIGDIGKKKLFDSVDENDDIVEIRNQRTK